MPLYEYQCKACEKTFEVLVMSSDRKPARCQFCNCEDVKKVLSPTSFRTGLSGLSSLGGSSGCGPGSGGFS